MLLGLINIGSSAAFNAVASLVVSGYLGSYTLPMILLLHKKLSNPTSVHYGPWTLGRRFGIFCNIFGLMWIAGVMQCLRWRAVNADGTLTYSFVEGVKATYPYYVVRLLGGALFLSGMFVMAWNVWKTVVGAQAVDAPIRMTSPAAA